jgi:hypothetical protein
MRRPFGVLLVLLLAFALTGIAGAETPQATPPVITAPVCKSLPVTAGLRTALRSAHHRVYARRFNGPPQKSTYHGRCGLTYYALASFYHPGVGYTDQPEVFKRRIKQKWRDEGDTGGDACGSKKVPTALLKAWKIRC